jgi:bacillithiol synthase
MGEATPAGQVLIEDRIFGHTLPVPEPVTIQIQVRSLPGSPLIQRYLARDPEILQFFAGDPFSIGSFADRWAKLQRAFTAEKREKAAEALHPTSDGARKKIERFVREGGAVITTGQQAGLFTGPLYTVYKILTAIRLAEALEKALGIVVLPTFWTASEDHDWAEVSHTYLVDQSNRLRRLEVPSPEVRPLPMAERRFERAVESVVEELAQTIAGADHQAEILKTIRAAYRPENTVASSFSQTIAALFSGFDLAMTDAAGPALKQASLPVLAREISARAEHEVLLRATVEQLEKRGISPQVPILPSGSNLFLRTEYGRERLYSERSGWVTRESRQRFSTSELEHLLAREPGRFSPNVLLRPIVESSVFPVLAYVAGPGEIAYFAQLRALFDIQGKGMPPVYPRASMLLVDDQAQRLLGQTGITADELRTPSHQLLRRRSLTFMPPDLTKALEELRADVTRRFDDVAALAGELEPTLQSTIGSRRNRVLLNIADAEVKILRAMDRRHQEWSREVDGARNHLFPLGSEQERVLNIVPFLARHGTALLSSVAAAIPIRLEDLPS